MCSPFLSQYNENLFHGKLDAANHREGGFLQLYFALFKQFSGTMSASNASYCTFWSTRPRRLRLTPTNCQSNMPLQNTGSVTVSLLNSLRVL
jgi:hypothetical protein